MTVEANFSVLHFYPAPLPMAILVIKGETITRVNGKVLFFAGTRECLQNS